MSPPAADGTYAWAQVTLVAQVAGRRHLVPCRCIVRTEPDGDRVVLVPWWHAWALRQHGPPNAN